MSAARVSPRRLVTVLLVVLPCGGAVAQTAPAPPAKVAAPEHTVPGTPATVLGQEVVGLDGKNLGRIVDVLVDKDGHPLAAVVDFGGFMGLGNRRIAVDWHNLTFDPKGAHPVTVDLTLDQLKAAPEFKGADTHVTVVGAPAAAAKQPD